MFSADFLPKGLSPYPSQQAYLLLNTPVGRTLLDATRETLATRWNMKPVGGEQKQALIDRTALLFVQQFGDKWQGSITAATVDNSDLETIVAFVSPLSEHKSATEILAAESSGGLSTRSILIGAGILAGVLLLVYALKGRKSKTEPFIATGEGI
jgi:hypothetical protein